MAPDRQGGAPDRRNATDPSGRLRCPSGAVGALGLLNSLPALLPGEVAAAKAPLLLQVVRPLPQAWLSASPAVPDGAPDVVAHLAPPSAP